VLGVTIHKTLVVAGVKTLLKIKIQSYVLYVKREVMCYYVKGLVRGASTLHAQRYALHYSLLSYACFTHIHGCMLRSTCCSDSAGPCSSRMSCWPVLVELRTAGVLQGLVMPSELDCVFLFAGEEEQWWPHELLLLSYFYCCILYAQ
jgi:hypothetical protein